jgi:hypothetical protein
MKELNPETEEVNTPKIADMSVGQIKIIASDNIDVKRYFIVVKQKRRITLE